MVEEIKSHLLELEKRENLKILYAAESGSRAWGCPSPDSDYDVRIIYLRHPDWYFSIDNKKDSMDYFHGELLDINGWDIRKTLRLLRKSNVTPFEWAQSPMVYMERGDFRNRLLGFARTFFQPNYALNHYKGIAMNSFESGLVGEKIKLKKLFYVIRPVLAAKWIIENKTVPPMDIPNLLVMVKDDGIKSRIKDLLKMKESANEDYVHTIESDLLEYLKRAFKFIKNTPTLDRKPAADSNMLDEFYRELANDF